MTDTIPVAQLRAFVERIERIEADIKDLNGDKSEVYKELRGCGFDVKAVRAVVAKRKLDTADREERDAMFDLYWSALNGEDRARAHAREIIEEFDPETGELTDNQESGQPVEVRTEGVAIPPVVGTSDAFPSAVSPASDESETDDVGATASSTNSPERANEVPAQDGGGTATGESPSGKSNAARPASVDAHVNDGGLAGEASDEVVTVVGDESGTLANPEMDRATESSFETGSAAAENAREAIPASPEDGSVSHAGAGEIPATNSNSPAAIPLGAANSAGEAPSSPASPARHSDDIDLTIPAFLDRRQPKAREWEEA